MIELPEWSKEHIYIDTDNNSVNITIDRDSRPAIRAIKKDMESVYSTITNWNIYNTNELASFARNYLIANIFLGLIDQRKAVETIQLGLNANDGTGRQHWIPECYLNEYAINGNIRKVDKGVMQEAFKKIEYNSHVELKITPGHLVSIKSDEFCEKKGQSGEIYLPEYEIILSKIEADYSLLNSEMLTPKTLWDFVVLTSFFFMFHSRTKERRGRGYSLWDKQVDILLDLIPNIIAESEVYSFAPASVFDKKLIRKLNEYNFNKSLTFPFNQHPIYADEDTQQNVSLWIIRNPQSFLWFRNKKSEIRLNAVRPLLFNKFLNTIGDNDSRVLYFRPGDPIWRISNTE